MRRYKERQGKIVYQRKHIKVKQCYGAHKVYYTVYNSHGTHEYHAHLDNKEVAIICANHAYNMHVPDHYSDFLKHAIRRVMFGATQAERIQESAKKLHG